MKLKYLFILITSLAIEGCQETNMDINRITVNSFQGFWRDTIEFEGKSFLEEFIVDNYAMNYSIRDIATNILVDKQDGIISIGNDSKMGWYCTSPITNDTRATFWEIRDITLDRMNLYSILLGEHCYQRGYRASIDEYNIADTLSELFIYQKLLPSTKADIMNSFGQYNALNKEKGISYLIEHPFINNVTFNENFENDSIYSYSMKLTNWEELYLMSSKYFTPVLIINENIDYCDGNSILDATFVIRLDATSKMMTIYNVKGYEFWPDISHYLCYKLVDVKNDYSEYVYKIEYSETKLKMFNYQMPPESVCKNVGFQIDSNEMVVATRVVIRERYANTKIILRLLNEKYFYDKKKNGTYYYYPSTLEDSKYQVVFDPEECSITYIGL